MISSKNKFNPSPSTVPRNRSLSLNKNDSKVNLDTGTKRSFNIVNSPGVRSTTTSSRKKGPIYNP